MGNRICSIEGCEKPARTKSADWCDVHYQRWWKHGTTELVERPVREVHSCTVDKCDRPELARGLCGMHYQRVHITGTTDLTPRYLPSAERLAAGLERKSNGCLEWTGCDDGKGYGVIYFDGKSGSTHRAAWTLAHGPIPDGMFVCHHCDNPPCCETQPTEGYPEGHLFLGDHDDNMRDMASKGRAQRFNALKTHCIRNHPYDEANTYTDSRGWRACRICKSAADIRRRKWKREVSLVSGE